MFMNKVKLYIVSIFLLLIMENQHVHGSFLENFLDYTMDHLSKGIRNQLSEDEGGKLNFHKNISEISSSMSLDLSLDGVLTGYSNYDLEKMSITPDLNLSTIVTIKDSQISGHYKMNGSYYTVIPIIGDGDYSIHLKNISIALDNRIVPKDGHIQIPSFDLDYSLDTFEISLWGLTSDQAVGNILEEFIKDLVSTALKTKKTLIKKTIQSYVLEQGNSKLQTMTLRNMIELIKEILVY